MKNLYMVLPVLLLASSTALAEQGCAPGFFPGGTQPNGQICVPIPGYGVTNNVGAPSYGGPRWKLTWGSIAIDDASGATGTVVGKTTRRAAKKESIARCVKAGGKNCRVILDYRNQCAVIADPYEGGKPVGGVGVYRSAESTEAAGEAALPECAGLNGGRECKVVYAECSDPIQIGG